MGTVCYRLIVTGVVQGVFFRDSCRAEAERLGVNGWVRNRGDGSVEALIEGEPEAVGQLTAWCRHGPPSAVVAGVESVSEQPAGLRGFRVVH